jgi:uncharacterized protein YbbK (DUF523 family)
MTETLTLFCSSCLLGKKCLYHGWIATFAQPALRDLALHGVRIVDACPEMLGGLPCPRGPSYVSNGIVTQSVGRSGRDVTPQFVLGARLALEILEAAHPVAALLLKNSPSCDPGFGIFGRQAVRLVKVVSAKRGLDWEAELQGVLQLPDLGVAGGGVDRKAVKFSPPYKKYFYVKYNHFK